MNRTRSHTIGTILVITGVGLGSGATAAAPDDAADALIAHQLAALVDARFGAPEPIDQRRGVSGTPGDGATPRTPHVAEIAALTEHLSGVPCPVRDAAPYARLAWCLDVLVDDAATETPHVRWGAYYRTPAVDVARPLAHSLAHVHAQLERALGAVSATDLGNVQLQSGTIGWPSESGYFVLPSSTDDGDFTFVPETDAPAPTELTESGTPGAPK